MSFGFVALIQNPTQGILFCFENFLCTDLRNESLLAGMRNDMQAHTELFYSLGSSVEIQSYFRTLACCHV